MRRADHRRPPLGLLVGLILSQTPNWELAFRGPVQGLQSADSLCHQ